MNVLLKYINIFTKISYYKLKKINFWTKDFYQKVFNHFRVNIYGIEFQ